MGRHKIERSAEKRHPWNEIILTPEEVEGFCEAYFEKCKTEQKEPTKPGLCVYLGISVDTYDSWRSNKNGKTARIAPVLKKAEAIMSDRLQQRKDSMALFLLKQPCYGGYTDIQSNQANGTLHVKVTFGGKPGK